MATQAEIRQTAKTRVRRLRAAMKRVDTQHELLDRRLMKLLDRKMLITLDSFNSFLQNYDVYYMRIKALEGTIIAAMTVFLVD